MYRYIVLLVAAYLSTQVDAQMETTTKSYCGHVLETCGYDFMTKPQDLSSIEAYMQCVSNVYCEPYTEDWYKQEAMKTQAKEQWDQAMANDHMAWVNASSRAGLSVSAAIICLCFTLKMLFA